MTPRDPVNRERLNPTYDVGDGLHPNDAGYRVMADAGRLQRRHVRARRRHPDHLEPGRGERLELPTKEPVEAHVGGREMDET